jgi:hypothetical protein
MRSASNKTVLATLEVTGLARLDLPQSVVHTQEEVGPGEHSGNPSSQYPNMTSPFDRYNQKHSNLREREEADLRYQNCDEVSGNAPLGKVSYAFLVAAAISNIQVSSPTLVTTTANWLSKLYLIFHIVNLLSHSSVTNSHVGFEVLTAVSTKSGRSPTRLHGATTQKTAIFIIPM